MLRKTNIKDNGVSLEFDFPASDYINVKFCAAGIQAEIHAYLYTDGPDLYSFFQNISTPWKNGKEKKSWKSIEGDLQFEATHDGLSHLTLNVFLTNHQSSENEWKVVGNLKIEFGLLFNLANDLKNIFLRDGIKVQ